MIRKYQQAIAVTIQQPFTHHVLKTMLCAWKSACQYATLYREKQTAIVKSILIKWIRNRRLKQSDVIIREQAGLQDQSIISRDPDESIVPQSVQDCQFDLSSSDICPANTSAQISSNQIQSRTLEPMFFHFKDSCLELYSLQDSNQTISRNSVVFSITKTMAKKKIIALIIASA